MTELTRDDLATALRTAFKEVLTDPEVIEAVFHPVISRVVLERMSEKFERVLGIDCTDHADRERTRKTMEFAEKTREWAESDEGAAAIQTFKKLMKVIDFAASGAVKGVVYFLFAGAISLIMIGVATHKSVKALMGW